MKNKILKKITAVTLSVITLMSTVTAASFSVSAAEADSSAVSASSVSVTVKKGGSYRYNSSYNLTGYKYTGNTSYNTYCLHPGLNAPVTGTSATFSGSQVKTLESAASKKNGVNASTIVSNIYKAVYYGYGGAGFTGTVKTKFNSYKSSLNSSMSDATYGYAMNHILLAYLYAGGTSSFSGSGSDYNASMPKWYSAAAAIWKTIAAQASSDKLAYEQYAQCYVINTGSSTQSMLYVVTNGKVSITKQCASDCSSFVKNNSSYSLQGAVFNIYTTKAAAQANKGSGSTYAGSVTTNASGKASLSSAVAIKSSRLYVIESKAPKGYALNKTVYTLSKSSTVDTSGVPTYTVTVSDTPYLVLDLTKISADSSVTEGNDCYSLAGAVYTVYTDKACTKKLTVDGASVTITTDSNGYGTYNKQALVKASQTLYAKETKASPGYEITNPASGGYQFYNSGKTVTKNGVQYPIYTLGTSSSSLTVNEMPGNDPLNVLLQKYDATTGKGTNTEKLAGAEFTVKYYAGSYSSLSDIEGVTPARTWVFKTDSNGWVQLEKSYLISGDDLYLDNDDVPYIPYGFITVEETKAPDGYQLNTDVYFASISQNTADDNLDWHTTNENIDEGVLQFPETQDNGGISIVKKATDGIVANVWFRVTSSGGYSKDFCTNAGGSITNSELINLPVSDTYTVEELGFKNEDGSYYYPKRYGTKPEAVTGIKLTSGRTYSVTFENKTTPGTLVINKSSDDNKVSNVYFEVTSSLGKTYKVMTNSKGTATLSNLQVYDNSDNPVKYTIHELGFADSESETGYSLPDYYITPDDQTVDLVNGVVTVKFKNEVMPLNIVITKYSDDDCTKYSSVWFNVSAEGEDYSYNKDIEISLRDFSSSLNTDSVGSYVLRDLPVVDSDGNYITYKVTELGYWDDDLNDYYIPPYFYDFNLTKEVTADPNAEIIDKDESVYGTSVVATRTDNGYLAQPAFVNKYKKANLKLIKTSFDDVVSDIYFKLESDNGYSNVQKTDESGNITWENLSVLNYDGTKINYTITELGELQSDGTYKIPDRYSEPESIKVNLTEPDDDIDFDTFFWSVCKNEYDTTDEVNFDNTPKTASLKIVKESEDGETNNIWFNVKTDSEDLGNYTTDNGDSVIIEDLPVFGADGKLIKYTVTELGMCTNEDELVDASVKPVYEIPERYVVPDSVSTTLSYDDTSFVTVVKVKNKLIRGSVTLYKQDDKGNQLFGSQWELYTSDGTLVTLTQTGIGGYTYSSSGKSTTLDTGSDGKLTVQNLPYGNYYFKEKQAPNGYILSVKKYSFSVSAAQTVTITAKNTMKTGSVTLYKQDGNGKAVSGSEWELYTSDGTLVTLAQTGIGGYTYSSSGKSTTLDTGSDGKLTVQSLPVGDYYFIEVKAPDGMSPYGKKIEFTISAGSDTALYPQFTVKDDKIVMYNTGGFGVDTIYFVGFTMLAISIAVVAVYTIRIRKKHGK